MKKIIILAMLLIVSAAGIASRADAAAGVGEVIAGTNYFLSIGNHFAVSQEKITMARQRGVPDEEIPVVFFLARQAKAEPAVIEEIRLAGKPWMEITRSYGFGPEIFYVPVEPNMTVGSPYVHAYGYYKDKPREEWSGMYLQDDEIINLVNLKFLSEHYKYPARDIMKMRHDDKKFYEISDEIEKQQLAAKNPPHKTGSKKQIWKLKKFIKKI